MLRDKLTRVIRRLCYDFKVDYALIDTKTRKREVVLVRHMIYYFLKKETKLSLSQIGSVFGQEHASALHGINKINGWLDTNDEIILEWYRLNEVGICRMIDMCINGNRYLVKKKYGHYEMIDMIANFFGEPEAEKFEKHVIERIIKQEDE
jgi:hypothetical protein